MRLVASLWTTLFSLYIGFLLPSSRGLRELTTENVPLSLFSSLPINDNARIDDRTPKIFMERTPSARRKDVRKTVRAAEERIHYLVFAIKQQNIDLLEAILLDVSDPNSARYGKYKTRKEISEMTSNPTGWNATVNHLKSMRGVTIVGETSHGEYITASAPISVWEDMLDTQFHIYQHTKTRRSFESTSTTTTTPLDDAASSQINSKSRGSTSSLPKTTIKPITTVKPITKTWTRDLLRCEHYSLPSELHPHVQYVLNTVQMPMYTKSDLKSGHKLRQKFAWNQEKETLEEAAQSWNIPQMGAADGTDTLPNNIFSKSNQLSLSERPSNSSQQQQRRNLATYTGYRPTTKNCFMNNTMTPCR